MIERAGQPRRFTLQWVWYQYVGWLNRRAARPMTDKEWESAGRAGEQMIAGYEQDRARWTNEEWRDYFGSLVDRPYPPIEPHKPNMHGAICMQCGGTMFASQHHGTWYSCIHHTEGTEPCEHGCNG